MKLLTLLFTLLLSTALAHAQGASVILFELDQVLTIQCGFGANDCIPDGQLIEIRQDINANGPSDDDPLAQVGECAACCNYNTLHFNGTELLGQCGQFFSEYAWTTVGALPANNRFWLRIQTAHAVWRSLVFIPVPGPQELDLTWTPCEVFTPCTATRSVDIIGASYWGPISVCVDVCVGSVTEIISQGPDGAPMNPDYWPLLFYRPGCQHFEWYDCDRECEPGYAYIIGDPVWDPETGYFHSMLYGEQAGCVCVTEEILPAEFGEFSAIPGDNQVRLAWNTHSETDVDYFELSRNSTAIARVSAHNNASGADYSYTDENVVNGTTYTYSIATVNLDGSRNEHNQTVYATPLHNLSVASDFALYQNYPNPFNAETTIEFSLPEQHEISLVLYDVNGRFVRTLLQGEQRAGSHAIKFNARDLPSGLYFYTLQSQTSSQTQKLLLLK